MDFTRRSNCDSANTEITSPVAALLCEAWDVAWERRPQGDGYTGDPIIFLAYIPVAASLCEASDVVWASPQGEGYRPRYD